MRYGYRLYAHDTRAERPDTRDRELPRGQPGAARAAAARRPTPRPSDRLPSAPHARTPRLTLTYTLILLQYATYMSKERRPTLETDATQSQRPQFAAQSRHPASSSRFIGPPWAGGRRGRRLGSGSVYCRDELAGPCCLSSTLSFRRHLCPYTHAPRAAPPRVARAALADS